MADLSGRKNKRHAPSPSKMRENSLESTNSIFHAPFQEVTSDFFFGLGNIGDTVLVRKRSVDYKARSTLYVVRIRDASCVMIRASCM